MTSRFLTIILLIVSQFCYGLTKVPEILRVCLDINSSTATIYWQSSTDICNSFKEYRIYSSQNKGPWLLVGVENQITTNTYDVFLSDVGSEWDFKITTYFACNGIDSFVSKSQSIDQNKPPYLPIDSISFDYTSQKVMVGWQKNPATDTKGYRVYNYINSIYDSIIETNSTSIILDSFNRTNPSYVSIATYDSCNLFAPIDIAHKPVYLNAKLDTCSKTINFNWTKYEGEGWSNVNQYLFFNKNKQGFTKHNNLLANQTTYLLSNISLGDSLCYYIRTEEQSTKKTSSSNTICFNTRKLIEPKINYLSNVTVDQNTVIKIYFEVDNKADTDSLILEKKENSTAFVQFKKLKSDATKTNYEIEDLNANFNIKGYSYRVKTLDKCGNESSVSNIGRTILLLKPNLTNDSYNFNWNLYEKWENGIENQIIETSNNRFTWNTFKAETSPSINLKYYKESLDSDSLCFRVKNHEKLNQRNTSSTTISNIQCIYTISEFYLPGTINPYSQNNILKVYGNGIDNTRGKIEVFNRWGEKIFETKKITEGWDGTINGNYVDMGNYIYKAYFYDQQNKFYLKTGTVFIIK